MATANSALAVAMAVAVLAAGARAQDGQIPSCATKLVPCAGYLNATTAPPESCCRPLKQAVKDEMPCLCKLFNSPDLLKAFNINVTQVLGLPKLCGLHSDVSVCSKTPPSASSATTPPPSTSSTTPGAGSGSSSKKDSSGTQGRATWIGVPGFVSLLMFGWSFVAL
ncbi:non-specific lipid-transfer protein 2-like [Iris pallida]|uniref:Non-specific lipid-transfer protein 2-like n=1 Tax=Iris pallida TaxID=29817 RepID=A0AAX6G009_IRIPA|nr:non-specific lipid-transfer protein 2-like [Iris pallida]